jgi:hypothetical protein
MNTQRQLWRLFHLVTGAILIKTGVELVFDGINPERHMEVVAHYEMVDEEEYHREEEKDE